MAEMHLAGRCGVYCGACVILRAGFDGGDLLSRVSKELGVPKEEIHCHGCQGPDAEKWRNCRNCSLVSCLDSKGFSTCGQCDRCVDRSCPLVERLVAIGQARGEDNIQALARFRSGDVLAWLAEQDRSWRCPSCGREAYWSEADCHHCGASRF